jgi:hypothetical protein
MLCNSERITVEADVESEMGRLPEELKDSYDAILGIVLKSAIGSRTIAERCLRWLLCMSDH